jgi:hypothetical protein
MFYNVHNSYKGPNIPSVRREYNYYSDIRSHFVHNDRWKQYSSFHAITLFVFTSELWYAIC